MNDILRFMPEMDISVAGVINAEHGTKDVIVGRAQPQIIGCGVSPA